MATPVLFISESYLKDSFDMLYAEGQAGAPKILSIGLHCRLIGRRFRLAHVHFGREVIEVATAEEEIGIDR